MKKKVLCGLAFLLFPVLLFAQAEEKISVATHYPSPFGVYKTLRLYPRTGITPGSDCPNAGEMVFNQDDKKIYFCNGNGNVWTALNPGQQGAGTGNCRIQEGTRCPTPQEIIDQKCTGLCYWAETSLSGKYYYSGVLFNTSATATTCMSYHNKTYFAPAANRKLYYMRCD